jgi:hypothetical protein
MDELDHVGRNGPLNPVDCKVFDNLVTCRKRGWIVQDDKGRYGLTVAGQKQLMEYWEQHPEVQNQPTPCVRPPDSMAAKMMAELKTLGVMKLVWPKECQSLAAMQECAARGWVEHDLKGRYVLTKAGRKVVEELR